MELYRRHRPTTFDEVYGQDGIVKMISRLLTDHKQAPHAYLATGPSGCGKTTILRIIANQLNCQAHDLSEVNCADDRGIDMVRNIRSRMTLKPMSGDCRVWILDECQALPGASQSVLLKMLEDPPKHVYFMLATTDPHKMLRTIRTRCTELKIKLLNDSTMEQLIVDISKKAKIKVSDDVKEKIVNLADGSARKALVFLHQVAGLDTEDEMLDALEKSEAEVQSIQLCRVLLDTRNDWSAVSKVLSGLSEEAEVLRRMVLSYTSKVMLGGGKQKSIAFEMYRSFNKPFYNPGLGDVIASSYEVVVRTRTRK